MIYPKRKIFAVLTFFCLNVVVASSQLTEEDIKDYDKGNYFYSLDEFKNALEFFTKLTEKYPENSKLNFKAGLCYFNIKLEEYNAIQCLEKAVKEIDSKYYESNLKGTGAPPEAWFFLGDAYHRTGQLKEASLAYHNYLYYVNKESEDYLKTIKRIGGLGISYDANLRPTGFVLENIPILNSEFSDYNPVVSGDGNTLVFTSHRNGIDKIFISSYEKGTWSKPEDITYQVGSADDFFTTAISYYGDELYLVNYDPYNSNIFVSKKENGSWTQMKALDNFINTVDIETGASISSGGDTLYFCSNRSGGYGGVDVYYSVKRNNKWLKSVNIGNVINTPGDEGSPRISNDGNTLFFCSDGHEGIGGMDIFWSEKGIDGKWMTPARFPVPINTADDDMSFYFFDDRKSGYISKLSIYSPNNRDIYVIKYNESSENFTKNDTGNNRLVSYAYNDDTLDYNEPDTVNAIVLNTDNIEITRESKIAKEENKTTGNVQARENVIENVEDYDSLASEISKINLSVAQITLFTDTTKDTALNVQPDLKNLDLNGEYTIQILALRKTHNDALFSKLKSDLIFKSYGGDGICRYSCGIYKSIENASPDLQQLKNLGFHDAFIRNIREIDNFNHK